jgi:heat shock protein HspQ
MNVRVARFGVGDLVHHRLFSYRGVVVRVDPEFSLSDEWYAAVAKTRPPRDAPWYEVLVDESEDVTYVAERNLEPDEQSRPVRHPLVEDLLGDFLGSRYEDETEVH